MTTADTGTAGALAALGTTPAAAPSLAQRAVDAATSWLARRTSRRGFLVQAGVVGTAVAVDPFGYVLRPGTAYAAVCGPGASCSSGWTVFCATINDGVNACPPGSIAAGWWKADGASLCGGGARYIVDCNATCTRCSTPGSRSGICAPSCQSCSCTCGPSTSCDQRRVCCNQFRYGQCNTQVSQVGSVQCRVVSCTPPWQFERCSTSPATDNRTVDHNSSELPQAYTQITRRYVALGENGSKLGATVYGELGLPDGGRYQRYQRGRISYSSATGAWETVGAISARYLALHGENGLLRYPTGPEQATAGGGAASPFQFGRISWSPATGAWETAGDISAHYVGLGAEAGPLGYPVGGDEQVAGGGAWSTRFERGRISSSPATGTWATLGPIARLYTSLGAEAGTLGLPIGAERTLADGRGRRSDFQRGCIVRGSVPSPLWMGQPIRDRWDELGGATGQLGYPMRSEEAVRDTAKRRVVFASGRLTYDPATGLVTQS